MRFTSMDQWLSRMVETLLILVDKWQWTRPRQLLQHFQISGKLETSPEQQRYVSWRRWYIFQITLYGCETWTVWKADRGSKLAFEMWCWRKLLGISYRDHITNEHIESLIGKQPSVSTKDWSAQATILWSCLQKVRRQSWKKSSFKAPLK